MAKRERISKWNMNFAGLPGHHLGPPIGGGPVSICSGPMWPWAWTEGFAREIF